jgi:hypothetical protein
MTGEKTQLLFPAKGGPGLHVAQRRFAEGAFSAMPRMPRGARSPGRSICASGRRSPSVPTRCIGGNGDRA